MSAQAPERADPESSLQTSNPIQYTLIEPGGSRRIAYLGQWLRRDKSTIRCWAIDHQIFARQVDHCIGPERSITRMNTVAQLYQGANVSAQYRPLESTLVLSILS